MLKTLCLSLGVAALFLLGSPTPSHAVCTITGSVVDLDVYDDTLPTLHRVRVRQTGLSSIYFYADTADDDLVEVAWQAMSNKNWITIQGDAASCPTTGGARFIGRIRYLLTR